MAKLTAAAKGDLVMIVSPFNCQSQLLGIPEYNVLFYANLGVYVGFAPELHKYGDDYIKNTLIPDHVIEMAVIKVLDIPAPRFAETSIPVHIGLESKVYIGFKEISRHLEETTGELWQGCFKKILLAYSNRYESD